jgi:hypothetical protein
MKTTLSLLLLAFKAVNAFAQTNPDLQLDTMSIRGSFPKDHVMPDIKFDSTVIELYHAGSRLAVIPGEFRAQINMQVIESTEMSSEMYDGNKLLLRIQMFVIPDPRNKNRGSKHE